MTFPLFYGIIRYKVKRVVDGGGNMSKDERAYWDFVVKEYEFLQENREY